MRYQSPDGPPLSNGKKPSLRACKEDDNSFEAKAPRIRSGSVSGLANPSPSPDHHHFSHFSISSDLPRPENQTASSPSASSSPNANNAHHDLNVGSPRREGGGDGLPQWGQRKRSRGARGDESSAHPRIQRRVVNGARLGGAAPQPSPPYSRSANLRPSLAARDPTTRSANEQSSGPSRPEKRRSPLSPPEKSHEMAPVATDFVTNGCTAVFPSVNLENLPPPPSDQGITGGGSSAVAEKPRLDQMQWPRIYLTLSRKEKEDDFLAMKGTKLPQRPKKRPKNVDKILQYCSPGMWLSDLTRSRYEVREKKCVKKKRRGLKGMESMDTDSE